MIADEFLDWVVDQEEHYELIDGQPVMMTGVNRRHDRIVVNALVSLVAQLRGRPSQPFTSETAVRIPAGNIRVPDLGVDCGRPDDRSSSAAEPVLVVEVLSPSTSLFDRTIKLEGYKTVTGLHYILLVDRTCRALCSTGARGPGRQTSPKAGTRSWSFHASTPRSRMPTSTTGSRYDSARP